MSVIRVVFCTDGVFPHQVGGMQRHSKLLVEELANNSDIQISVIHPHEGIEVFSKELGITEFPIKGIDTSKNYLKECKAYSKRVKAIIDQLPKDTIIYNQGLSVWDGIEEVSNRVVTNPHGLEPFQAMSKKDRLIAIPFKRIFSKIFRKSKFTVSLGGHLTGILSKIIPNEKIIVLPNAVSVPETQLKTKPDSEEPLKFLFVARFAANKGIDVLMRAISELNEEGYEDKFQFNLGGKGPLYKKYKTENQHKNVQLLGFVSDDELKQLYATSDAFVFPTLFEGMPTVVLEAMCYQLPIIVSDTGATKEQVDAENGFIITPGSVKDLKQALVSYFKLSTEEKNSMSKASYERVCSKFTWRKVAEKHIQLFHKMNNQ